MVICPIANTPYIFTKMHCIRIYTHIYTYICMITVILSVQTTCFTPTTRQFVQRSVNSFYFQVNTLPQHTTRVAMCMCVYVCGLWCLCLCALLFP